MHYIQFFAYGPLAWSVNNPLRRLLMNKAECARPSFLTSLERGLSYKQIALYDSMQNYPILAFKPSTVREFSSSLSPSAPAPAARESLTTVYGITYSFKAKIWLSLLPLILEYENPTQTCQYLTNCSSMVLNVDELTEHFFYSSCYSSQSEEPYESSHKITLSQIEEFFEDTQAQKYYLTDNLEYVKMTRFLNEVPLLSNAHFPLFNSSSLINHFESAVLINNCFTFAMPYTYRNLNLFSKLSEIPTIHSIQYWKETPNA